MDSYNKIFVAGQKVGVRNRNGEYIFSSYTDDNVECVLQTPQNRLIVIESEYVYAL